MQHDNKNFILAIALSLAIIVGWQFFFAKEPVKKPASATTTSQQSTTGTPAAPAPGTPTTPQAGVPQAPDAATPQPQTEKAGAGPTGLESVEAAIAKTARVKISTARIVGSINLTGAAIDDLSLREYHEKVDKSSPIIRLLAPSGTKHGYFADQGWQPASGTPVSVPTSKSVWKVEGNDTLTETTPVTLVWNNNAGLIFKRKISVDNKYLFTISQSVANTTGKPVQLFPYSRVQRQEIPKLVGVYVIHEGMIGVIGDETHELDYSDAKDDGEKINGRAKKGWVGITDKYWAVATIPDQTREFDATMAHIALGQRDAFQAHFVVRQPITIASGKVGTYKSKLFAGAKVVKILQEYRDKQGIVNFENLVDWGWFYFITKPMFWLLHTIQSVVGNFGIAILLITLIVKAAFFPLASKSYKSMAQMKKLQPEMARLKERYGDDKAEMQRKTMELYKKEKVSPLAGCLPMVLQIPVFFSLYKVLFVTIEMRHAPFYLWIKDLSAPDPTTVFNLFGLLPFTPPSILAIGVLPLIMGITMWIQMKLNPAPTDPTQAMMFNIMPIAFTFMLGTFPSGLVLYWAWSNFLSIIQQYTIMKGQGVEVNLMKNIRDSLPSFGKKKTK